MTKTKDRPDELEGVTTRIETGCGPLYVTINYKRKIMFEVFARMGKAGGCASSQNEALGRLISLALRTGIKPEGIVHQLRSISCHQPRGIGKRKVWSCADGIAIALHRAIEGELKHSEAPSGYIVEDLENDIGDKEDTGECGPEACPECGGKVIYQGGCKDCTCGWSECG